MIAGAVIVAGCHANVRVATPPPVPEPKTTSPKYAPIYTDGPVPIPGETPRVPYVLARNGEPVIVAPVPPGSLMTFNRADAKAPKFVLLRRRAADASAKDSRVWKVPTKLLEQAGPGGKKKGSVVGFDVPQLPGGVYDAWYADGSPVGNAPSGAALLAPPVAKASQFVTFEIRPTLRPAHAVVRGAPGAEVDVAIGIAGPPSKTPVSVTLSGFNDNITLAPSQAAETQTGSDGLAHFRVRIAAEGDAYLYAKSPGLASVAVRLIGGPYYKLRRHRLQPGDVLLCQGNKTISDVIQFGERSQLGSANPLGRPWYSHVAIVLGNGETAEMLNPGLVKHTVEDTVDDCTTVDVYRRVGITAAQQKRVVANVRSYGWMPYAWSQIAVLGSAGTAALSAKIERHPVTWLLCLSGLGAICAANAWVQAAAETTYQVSLGAYVVADRGRPAMICSELAAWAYRDAENSPDVAPWWPELESRSVLLLPDARTDFTTPNMIAHSKDMDFVFQLWPPVPAAKIAGGQIQVGEQIEFETGSAKLEDSDEDLLEEVVKLLKKHPEIKRVRVEGHTDDVGAPPDNQRLSEARANAVVKWLVAHGIDAARLSAAGFGEDKPLRPNDSPQNRRKNRRVELHIGAK